MQSKVNISVGQAILNTYSKVPVDQISDSIKELYLNGLKPELDDEAKREVVERAIELDQMANSAFSVSYDPRVINNDASRRYFETQLSYQTLKHNLLSSQSELLENLLEKTLEFLNPLEKWLARIVFSGKFDHLPFAKYFPTPFGYNQFFSENSPLFNGNFTDEEIKVISTLAKLDFIGMLITFKLTDKLPINIYNGEVYNEKNRGRERKLDNEVSSNSFGIIRNYDVSPYYDEVTYSETPIGNRPINNSNYVLHSVWPKKNFSQLVHPFVNSISGTLLAQLRIIKHIEIIEGKPIFQDIKQLKNFFQCWISVAQFFYGAHTFNEFVTVFQLSEVQEAFSHIEGFNSIIISSIFYEDNQIAFDAALSETIKFNEVLLGKKSNTAEILTKFGQNYQTELDSEEEVLNPADTTSKSSTINEITVSSLEDASLSNSCSELQKLETSLNEINEEKIAECYNDSRMKKEAFETEKNKLQTIINEYCAAAKAFTKHGLLGAMAAEHLLSSILENTAKIENAETKLLVMRKQLKAFVATGKSHSLLPESGTDEGSLRAHIITKFFSKPTDSINETINRQKRKKFTKEQEAFLEQSRKKNDIPAEGKSYEFSYKVAEAPFSFSLNPHLYAHCKLKVKEGVPCDTFDNPLEDGIYQFVVLTNNEFRFLPTKTANVPSDHYQTFIKYRSHHQMAGGQNVYGAGNFAIKDQKIVWIDGGSGHYGTQKMRFVNYATDLLKTMGINTENIEKFEKIPSMRIQLGRLARRTKTFLTGVFSSKNLESTYECPQSHSIWEGKIPKF